MSSNRPRQDIGSYLKRNWQLYTMWLPGFVLILLFNYLPMFGLTMAFQNFKPAKGFLGSAWIDPWYKWFKQLFTDPFFGRTFRNTILLGIDTLLFSFPAPILFALMLNEIHHSAYKRVVQTISYMPYFLSTVIVIGLFRTLLSPEEGLISSFLGVFGVKPKLYFNMPSAFRTLYVSSSIWQNVGYNSIIYLAAIAGIDVVLYEAAIIDGASRMQQIVHITIPQILPTVIILLIFAVSGILGNDFQKILLMYSPNTYETADVLNTYVFRSGIEGSGQSYSAAVGLFTSIISFFLLVGTNFVARKVGETSLW